ncbi:MAG: PAS domain-containing protein [Anaerolineae bacterium]|jgi:predicted transcriptional regulator YheO|nr:PAS domain-containing protein [Anaerolineae bacterium]
MCEVVVHDFADLERSIVYLQGNVTHRTIGGSATDLILECIAQGKTDQDLYGYATSLPGGRMMKSSTIFLRDSRGRAIGALCVNLDVTDLVAARNVINALVHTKDEGRTIETFSDNIFDTVQAVLAETLYETGRSLHGMSREDKVELIHRLEAKGLFQIKKAVPIVADLLSLSRATVYNYLRQGRHSNHRKNGSSEV